MDKVIQLGHVKPASRWKNSTRYRLYNTQGIAPTLTAGMGGGGNLIPFILLDNKENIMEEYEERKD